jgi:prophage antirepressor-like protein
MESGNQQGESFRKALPGIVLKKIQKHSNKSRLYG